MQDKRRMRGIRTQQGRMGMGYLLRRPLPSQIRLFNDLYEQNSTIATAIDARAAWVVSSIGTVYHDDPKIAKFHNDMIAKITDDICNSWHNMQEEILREAFISGFSTTEQVQDIIDGKRVIRKLVTHPSHHITVRPDKNGDIYAGKMSYDGYHKSGIWLLNTGYETEEIRFDDWRTIHYVNRPRNGGYYGNSLVKYCYKWDRLKDAFLEMFAADADLEGKRTTFLAMESFPVPDLKKVDPETGDEVEVYSTEFVRDQIEAEDGYPPYIILPKYSDKKIDVANVVVQDTVSDVKMEAIRYFDCQSIKHIIPPWLLPGMMDDSPPDDASKERQLDLYIKQLHTDRNRLKELIIKRILMPLQEWNFSGASAKVPPVINDIFGDRPEDRVAVMQMAKGLSEAGYLNPRNVNDYVRVMQALGWKPRDRDEDDMEWIYEQLVMPKEKPPRADDVKVSGSGRKGKPVGTKTKQINAKLPQT